MRRVSIGCLLATTLLSLGSAVVGDAQAREPSVDETMMIALDLMDVDIPGEGSGDQLELPPIEEPVIPAKEAPPSTPEPVIPAKEAPPSIPEKEPVVVERTPAPMPATRPPAQSPMPGIAPFLLEGPDRGAGTTKASTKPAGTKDVEAALQEVPAELKTVPPPPSRPGSLKLPSGTDVRGSGEADLPEIPLLKGADKGQEMPVPGTLGSGLSMKPMQGLDGAPVVSPDAGSSEPSRRAADYLQIHEDFDSRLIDIYESYYKDR
jgi:hypothetical protein